MSTGLRIGRLLVRVPLKPKFFIIFHGKKWCQRSSTSDSCPWWSLDVKYNGINHFKNKFRGKILRPLRIRTCELPSQRSLLGVFLNGFSIGSIHSQFIHWHFNLIVLFTMPCGFPFVSCDSQIPFHFEWKGKIWVHADNTHDEQCTIGCPWALEDWRLLDKMTG